MPPLFLRFWFSLALQERLKKRTARIVQTDFSLFIRYSFARQRTICCQSRKIQKKRMTGVEPACEAWEASILPLYYVRKHYALIYWVFLRFASVKKKSVKKRGWGKSPPRLQFVAFAPHLRLPPLRGLPPQRPLFLGKHWINPMEKTVRICSFCFFDWKKALCAL